jgi:hypothetical protein
LLASALPRRKPNLTLLFSLAFFGALLLLLPSFSFIFPSSFRAYALTPGTYSDSPYQSIDLNLTFGMTLRVFTPETSNVSILSLAGGQYDTGLYAASSKNDLLFTPAQLNNYSLVLNISAIGPNSASISELGTPASTWTKNITGTGNLLLNLTIDVVPQPVAQSSGWNPLFGFTGISLGGITLNATDILAIFALFSACLIIIGLKRSHKLLYTGLFFMALIGMIEVGILVVGLILGTYLAGFLIIKSYFGFRARKQQGL